MDSKQSYQTIVDSVRPKVPINILPRHDSNKFIMAMNHKKIDKVYEDGSEVGFIIKGDPTFYEIDDDYGFFEANGCYYNKQYQPAGWWVKDRKNKEHYYNIEGILEAQDDDDFEIDNNKEQIENRYEMDVTKLEIQAKKELQQQINQLYIEEKKFQN